MNRNKYLTVLALAISVPALVLGHAQVEPQPDQVAMLRNKASTGHRLTPLEEAFLGAVNALEQDSSCSRFYGGPEVSVRVLSALVDRLHAQPMEDLESGIKMSGGYTCYYNARGKVTYRLFEDAYINYNGPFCRTKSLLTNRSVPPVGSFPPNTRESRILILLHELAHLLTGPDGNWLIPDDGNNPALSTQNTLTIEARCGDQIRAIKADQRVASQYRVAKQLLHTNSTEYLEHT
jgi:hypothetical protein